MRGPRDVRAQSERHAEEARRKVAATRSDAGDAHDALMAIPVIGRYFRTMGVLPAVEVERAADDRYVEQKYDEVQRSIRHRMDAPARKRAVPYDQQCLQRVVYQPAQDEVIAALGVAGSERIADIACGTGILASRIAEELRPERSTASTCPTACSPKRAADRRRCPGSGGLPSNCRSPTGSSTPSSPLRHSTSSTSRPR